MRQLTILQLNDLHGYLAPHAEIFDLVNPAAMRSGGGLARIATMLRAVRREVDGAALTLDSGDTFHGTMAAVHTRGEALIGPMRALGPDAMTAHWEFAYGLQRVGEIADRLPYPILGANCRMRPGARALHPFSVVERAGVRVGVIGLAAVVAEAILPPEDRGRLELTMGESELRSCIPGLRREHSVDLIVVVSHLGFPQDCKLATVVPGIDVLVSGHTHNRLEAPAVVNETVIIQSGAHGSFVGRLDVTIGRDGLAGWTHALVQVDDAFEADAAVKALVDEALGPFEGARANVVAETECALHRYAMFESTMDNLLLDATAAAAGTSVALSNGWRYGAPIPAGPLTELDLWNIVPANPPVSVVELTVRQLQELLEENLEATFSCDAWKQRGGYVKRCRGIEVLLKLENPAGHRIQELTVGGARLPDDAKIDVGFLGDQAVPADRGGARRSTGVTAVAALEDYLRQRGSVAPVLERRINVV